MQRAVLPPNYNLLYDVKSIAASINRIAEPISAWARNVELSTGQSVFATPILRGGLFFFADLVRQLSTSVDVAEIRTTAYVAELNGIPHNDVTVDIRGADFRGRSVLLVDDICDSGRTLFVLGEELRKLGALEVRAAVLVRRILPGHQQYSPEWSAFEFPGSEWLVGYGMEDGGRNRNLPDVYTLVGTGKAT